MPIDGSCCVDIITTLGAKDAEMLERCLEAIFSQEIPLCVQLVRVIIGVEEGVREINEPYCPSNFHLIKVNNKKDPKDHIYGRQTGRSNFLNCVNHVKAELVMFCHHDDYWNDKLCISKHVKNFLETCSATALCQNYVDVNDAKFRPGSELSINDFSIPSTHLFMILKFAPLYKIPALDYYIITIESAVYGVKRIEGNISSETDRKDSSWKTMRLSNRQKHMARTIFYILHRKEVSIYVRMKLLLRAMKLIILTVNKKA